MNMSITRFKNWFWPVVISGSALSTVILTVLNVDSPIRAPIAFWFMGFCPGMAFVGGLNLKGMLSTITFAVALSLALDMLVSELIVYARIWSPDIGILMLASLTFIGLGLSTLSLRYVREIPNQD